MASRSSGTLFTGNSAAYVPPSLMPGYQGHVPTMTFSFGDTYGNASCKYFNNCRNSSPDFRYGGHFPILYSGNPNLVLGYRSHAWDRWLHTPTYTRYNLDCNRSAELKQFYKLAQMHREQYQDKTGTMSRVPYFVLPVKEKDRYSPPADLSSIQNPEMVQNLNCSPRL